MTARAKRGEALFHQFDNVEAMARAPDGKTGSNALIGTERPLPPGISFDRKRRTYRVRITRNGVRRHVGVFAEVRDAAEALRAAQEAAEATGQTK